MFRRPELLVAASVPVLLLAGVLSWHRDVLCTQAGCGTVAASAWTGSPVWAAVLLVALALGGVWVLLPPTRGGVPPGVAALTGVAGVVSAGIVLVSLDALVFNHAAFFGFDLPVTETFPVLAVHPGPGLLLGLLGLVLQAVGGWSSVRSRTTLLAPPRRIRGTTPAHWPPANPAAPPANPWPAAAADPWPAPPPSASPGTAATAPAALGTAGTAPAGPGTVAAVPAAPGTVGASPGSPHVRTQPPAAVPPGAAWEAPVPPAARPPQPQAGEAVPNRSRHGRAATGPGWEAAAFGQGAPPPRHRRRAE